MSENPIYAAADSVQYAPAAPAPLTTREQAAALGAAVPQDRLAPRDNISQIPFKGDTFTLNTDRWTFEVQDAFEQSMNMTGVRLLFGDEEFDRMKTWNFFEDLPKFIEVIKETRAAGK